MFWDLEVTADEEERYVRLAAEKIHKYGMETAAILFLESSKPLAYIGGEMGRFFISPFLPALGEEIGITGEKLFLIFEKRENLERLIKYLEDMATNNYDWDEHREIVEETEEQKEDIAQETDEEEEPKKKGWRRFLPF